MVSGHERKIQYITCGDGFVVEFGQHVIEGIGNTYFMFPTYDGTMNGPLRCYQDDSTGLFINPFHSIGYGWNNQDCEQIITSIDETKIAVNIAVFPNPTKDVIHIENRDLKTVSIYVYNNLGKVIAVDSGSKSNYSVDLTNQSKGLYLVRIVSNDAEFTKIIIKQ